MTIKIPEICTSSHQHLQVATCKMSFWHNTSTRLIGVATAKDAWLILFWFLRQFYVIKRQIAAELTVFKIFSSIWKPSQAFYALATTVALCKPWQFYSYLGVYTAETVHPKIRNNLTILPSIFVGLGMLFVWIIGYLVTWRITAYILALPNILIFLSLLLLPESPYWLIEANKIDLAEYEKYFLMF